MGSVVAESEPSLRTPPCLRVPRRCSRFVRRKSSSLESFFSSRLLVLPYSRQRSHLRKSDQRSSIEARLPSLPRRSKRVEGRSSPTASREWKYSSGFLLHAYARYERERPLASNRVYRFVKPAKREKISMKNFTTIYQT